MAPFSSKRLKSGALSFTFIRVSPRTVSELRQPLYRKGRRAVICCALLVVLLMDAPGQTPRPKRKEPALRALAVLELTGDSKTPGRGRLVPIYVLEGGKYYDAGLYRVRPRPMAVEAGTVYEAERSGEPAGLFTVEQAVEQERAWFAVGGWVPREFEQAKPKSVTVKTGDDEDAPPVLRRPKPGGEAGAPPAASSPPTKDTAGGGRATPAEAPPEPDDPDRPRLRRGKPKQPQQDAAAFLEEFAKASASTVAPGPERMVAISDASLPQRRPYAFPWIRDEQERLAREITEMAQAALAKSLEQQAANPVPAKPAPRARRDKKPEPAVLPILEEVRVRAFDLNNDNNVEVVLTARHSAPATASAPARAYYVTVVAAVAIGGELRRLLASVTEEQRLDSVPRLELIDAVDAEGNGDGELLFRRVGRTRQSYELFRVGMDKLWTLFAGAASPL